MRGGVPTFLGSMAGVCQDVRPRSGPGTWLRLARLAATYLLILVFVAPAPFAGATGPAAHRNQKSNRQQRANSRPCAAAKAVISLATYRCRNPEYETAVPAGAQRTLLSPPVLTPVSSENSDALTVVFRPLRC